MTVDEVADAALFLASGLSSGITGQLLPVDAGHAVTDLTGRTVLVTGASRGIGAAAAGRSAPPGRP